MYNVYIGIDIFFKFIQHYQVGTYYIQTIVFDKLLLKSMHITLNKNNQITLMLLKTIFIKQH